MELKRNQLENERNNKKFSKGLQENVEEFEDKDEEMKPDKEEVFLRQFPGLSVFYRNNKQLKKKHKNNENFTFQYGNWIPPTCCSLLVNFIQWQLTFSSILLYKSDIAAYWQPELVRADLESEFRQIQDLERFWNFTENTLGNYIFPQQKFIQPDESVNT